MQAGVERGSLGVSLYQQSETHLMNSQISALQLGLSTKSRWIKVKIDVRILRLTTAVRRHQVHQPTYPQFW
jgi:hypothetical protein